MFQENQRNQLDAALADREQLQSNLEAVQSDRLPSDRSVDSQRTDRGLRTGTSAVMTQGVRFVRLLSEFRLFKGSGHYW